MSEAVIRWISGPVLKARIEGPFRLREAVRVGEHALLGEVVCMKEEEIFVQVYEDTTGLRPGVRVTGTGSPLAIRLGPGILGRIFDGLLRPLSGASSPYVEPGLLRADHQRFAFTPTVRPGDIIEGGGIFGTVAGIGGRAQKILAPPSASGEVVHIVEPGEYDDREPVCTLRGRDGRTQEIAMSHISPVRVPRPIKERLPSEQPLLTGQRILDCLFPVALGGKAMIPGGFGTGKTILLETLAKSCNADIIIYVGCGERGNELAGVLKEFPELQDPRTGRPLMERTMVIANTSNMPVSAREASIYSGVTVAEYFRDQGFHVALMADSTSRWAEALREVSGRLGELPGEGGYPAYLSTRLAEFYERAGRVVTLSGLEGSITLMGAVSPPSGDFSEPVVSHTKRYIKSFWALDAKRAQARFYPAINPILSYSEDAPTLASWWRAQGNAQWADLRRRFLTLLQDQVHLDRMARIIGKDALPPRQQMILICAELVNDAFLRQSAFSENDHYASTRRQTAMMRILGRFIDLAEKSVAAGTEPGRLTTLGVYRRLQRMGEEIGEEALDRFKELERELESAFIRLQEEHAREAVH